MGDELCGVETVRAWRHGGLGVGGVGGFGVGVGQVEI